MTKLKKCPTKAEIIGWLCPYCKKWTMIVDDSRLSIFGRLLKEPEITLATCEHFKAWDVKKQKPTFIKHPAIEVRNHRQEENK